MSCAIFAVVAVSANVLIPKKIKTDSTEFNILNLDESTKYLHPITNKYSDYAQTCPRSQDMIHKQTSESFNYHSESGEQTIVYYRHCVRCSTGVYSEHAGEEGKHCTFCGDKEPSDN